MAISVNQNDHFEEMEAWMQILQIVENYTSKGQLKFVFSKKATKIDKIFTVHLTVTKYIMSNGR